MPVGFSSPARNLFLLASTAGGTLGNFFKTIDRSAGTDVNYRPSEIRNIYTDNSYTLAGQAERSSGDEFGWIENVSYDGSTLTENWTNDIQSTVTGTNTTLRALEIDGNGNYLAVGKSGTTPWISRYTSAGVLDWSSTSNSADVEYYGIAVDSNNNYYACGSTPTSGEAQAFVEKFDGSGTPGWGKSSVLLGGDVNLNKLAANSRGEVIAVGYITEASSTEAKGYIVKIDTTTGEVQWDRSIECSYTDAATSVLCEDVTIDDEDNFYIVGRLFTVSETRAFVARYSPEGNLIWQKETPFGEHFEYYQVRIDNTTKQMITYGRYIDDLNQQYGVLTKYESIGDQIWRRKMYVSNTGVFGQTGNGGSVNLDEDTQWYYMLYIDMNNADKYTFGRVSSSGNGLGAFQYAESTGETVYYEILNIDDRVGRLTDGSVRNDSSDLVTYPFNANKLLFDDLATPITNKKVQVSEPNTFDYSGSPAVRRADFISLDFETETRTVNISSGDDVGQVDFTTVGTTDFTVPPNVTTISAVCVGGGGGAGATGGNRGGGGGAGGGLAYGTFAVTPGEVLRISVGAGGTFGVGTSNPGGNGGDTTITRLSDSAVLLNGGGGSGGTVSPTSGNGSTPSTSATGGTSSGTERDGGGTGGNGGRSRYNFAGGAGGGAAGYSGNGGNGASGNTNDTPTSGSGGGGSGGTSSTTNCGGGGGVGIYGEGASGVVPGSTGTGGNGGSSGANGTVGNNASDGGAYGGGGGADDDDFTSGTNGNGVGGQGAARIIWGTGRSYPSTLTNNQTPSSSTTSSETFVLANKNREGIVSGAVKNGDYWEFNGSNSYLEFTNFNGFKGGDNPFTVSLWLNTDHGGTDADEHVFFYGDEATGQAIRIRLYDTGGIGVGHWGGAGYDWGAPAGTYNLNEWTMITETYDGTTDRIYVNGVEVASDSSLNTLSIPTQATLYIGRRISGRYYSGNVGQVSCYDRALTAAQVFQNYNATKSKYINEAPDTAPKIGPGIVYDSNLLLNYDFGNRATYDDRPYPIGISVSGQTGQTITASDGLTGDFFGGAVAVGNDKIVIGADGDDGNFSGTEPFEGIAYIYDIDGTNEVILQASDTDEFDDFGCSVAVGNNKIAVGAQGHFGSLYGAVYTYDLDGTNEVKISASDRLTGGPKLFGWSVAIGNNKIAVGAIHNTSGETQPGAVYVYDLDGTNEVKITASDEAAGDEFGWDIAIANNKIVVGASGDDSNKGAVYVYDLDGTNEVKITASDGASGNAFGRSVAIESNKIFVAQPFNDNAVYRYDLDGTNEVKITDTASDFSFARSIAAGENKLLVGGNNYAIVYDIDGNELLRLTGLGNIGVQDQAVAIGPKAFVIGSSLVSSSTGEARIYSLVSTAPTTVKNLSSSSYTGTINGATFNPAGYFDFDGAGTDKIDVPNTLTTGETFTISAWVNADDLSGRSSIFSTRSTDTAGGWQLEVGTGDTGSNRIGVAGVNTWIYRSNNNTISTGTWYHITLVKANNSTDAVVYLNGSSLAAADTAAYTISNNSNVRTIGLGTNGATDTNFDGKIGELQYYDRALSATEVSQNFNATRSKYGV